MLSKYRLAFQDPRARAFSSAGFVARLPISMVGIGILMFVEHARGSYALAGSVFAIGALANSIGGPVTSRLVDKFGQSKVLPWQIATVVTTSSILIFIIPSDLPSYLIFVIHSIGGFCAPSIGALVRARWTALLVSGPLLITAFSVESLIDEIIFVIGPAVAAFTSVEIHPAAPQLIGMACLVAGGIWLLSLKATEPKVNFESKKHGKPVAFQFGLPWLVGIHFFAGVFFGAVETTVIAFSDFADAAVFAGVILAMWSIGSLTGGLIYGSIDFKMPLSKQLGLLGALLVPPALALPFVNSIWQLALLSVLAGFGVAPLLIAAASMAQQRAGDGRTTEAISSMYSGIGLGFAFAAAGAGLLIDNHGTEWAFFIGSMASLAITLLALVAQKSLETPVGSQ